MFTHRLQNLRKRFAAYLAASLALLGSVQAAITYSGVQDIAIPATFDGVYLDIISASEASPLPPGGDQDPGGGSYTISYNEPASGNWDVNFFFGGIGLAHSPTFNPYRSDEADIFSPIHNLGLNTVIDGGVATAPSPGSPPLPAGGSSPLLAAGYGGSGSADGSPSTNHLGSNTFQFASGTEGYLAFVLEDGGTTYNGWMRVTLTDDGTPGVIHDWAYDTEAISVGAIPEPGSTLLLLVGSALLLHRRRV